MSIFNPSTTNQPVKPVNKTTQPNFKPMSTGPSISTQPVASGINTSPSPNVINNNLNKNPTATLNPTVNPISTPAANQPSLRPIPTGPSISTQPVQSGINTGPSPQVIEQAQYTEANKHLDPTRPGRIAYSNTPGEANYNPNLHLAQLGEKTPAWLNEIANRNEQVGNNYQEGSGGRAGWLARGGKPWTPSLAPLGQQGSANPVFGQIKNQRNAAKRAWVEEANKNPTGPRTAYPT